MTETMTNHRLDLRTFRDYSRVEILAGDGKGKELHMKTIIDDHGTVLVSFTVITTETAEIVTRIVTRLLEHAINKYNEL